MDTNTARWVNIHAKVASSLYELSQQADTPREFKALMEQARYHYGKALRCRLELLGYTPNQAKFQVWAWRDIA